MQVRLLFVGACAAALVTNLAFAQSPSPATSASGAPARLDYRSAFDGYRAYEEPAPRSWRESNEEAAALGGHAGHIKKSMAPAAPGMSKPATAGDATRSPADAMAPSAPARSHGASDPSGSPTSPAMKPAAPGHQGHGK